MTTPYPRLLLFPLLILVSSVFFLSQSPEKPSPAPSDSSKNIPDPDTIKKTIHQLGYYDSTQRQEAFKALSAWGNKIASELRAFQNDPSPEIRKSVARLLENIAFQTLLQAPSEAWYRYYLQDRKVGYAHLTTTLGTLQDKYGNPSERALRFDDEVKYRLNGKDDDLHVRTYVEANASLRPRFMRVETNYGENLDVTFSPLYSSETLPQGDCSYRVPRREPLEIGTQGAPLYTDLTLIRYLPLYAMVSPGKKDTRQEAAFLSLNIFTLNRFDPAGEPFEREVKGNDEENTKRQSCQILKGRLDTTGPETLLFKGKNRNVLKIVLTLPGGVQRSYRVEGERVIEAGGFLVLASDEKDARENDQAGIDFVPDEEGNVKVK